MKGKLIGVLPAQPIHDQFDALLGLIQIGIAFFDIALRNAVGAEEKVDLVGILEFCQFPLNGLHERFDVSRLVLPGTNPCDPQLLERGRFSISSFKTQKPEPVVVTE